MRTVSDAEQQGRGCPGGYVDRLAQLVKSSGQSSITSPVRHSQPCSLSRTATSYPRLSANSPFLRNLSSPS